MNKGKPRVKRKMFFANHYEVGALEAFLVEEAASGWMFQRVSGMFYVFEECEPRKVKFQVDYFDKATMFDSHPECKTLDYIEYCRESGWHHLFSSGKMQIFYSPDENVVPIQTDEKEKLHLIGKATIMTYWVSWIFLPLLWMLTMLLPKVLNILNPKSYVSYAYDVVGFDMVIFVLCFILYDIINITRFGIFYVRNLRRVNNKENIQYFSLKNVKTYWTFNLIYLLFLLAILAKDFVTDYLSLKIFLLQFLVIIAFMVLINKMVHSKWANRKTNMALTIVAPIVFSTILMGGIVFGIFSSTKAKITSENSISFYETNKTDITLNDLGVEKPDNILYEEKNHDREESFLAAREEYSDYYLVGEEYFGYSLEIFSSKIDAIMEQYNRLVLKNQGYMFTKEKTSRKAWEPNQTYYGEGTDGSMYVVIGEGRTYLVTGDLNKTQMIQLVSYYVKK